MRCSTKHNKESPTKLILQLGRGFFRYMNHWYSVFFSIPVFFKSFKLFRLMPTKIKITPIHFTGEIDSDKTSEDINIATGSSDDVKIVPRLGPTCGIPIE